MRAPFRPTFEIEVWEPADTVRDRTARALRATDCPVRGAVTADRIELHVPSARQHLWSPELRVDVQPNGEGCRLRGRYGPHPHVWLTFAAIYGTFAFGAFVALTFATAEWMLGQALSGLYAFAILVVLTTLVRSLAFVGQGLGGPQMDELRAFLEGILEQGAPAASVPRHSGVRSTLEQDGATAEALRSANR